MLICFTGKSGCGKSTSCDIIKNLFPDMSIEIIKFADPVYQIMYYIQDICKIHKHKDRKLLQFIGHDLRSVISEDIWCKKFEERLQWSNSNIILCDDLRYNNEADLVKKYKGIIIKIINNTCNDEHESEKGIDLKYIDYQIFNSGNDFYKLILESIIKNHL